VPFSLVFCKKTASRPEPEEIIYNADTLSPRDTHKMNGMPNCLAIS
jgi:hypothetical protein